MSVYYIETSHENSNAVSHIHFLFRMDGRVDGRMDGVALICSRVNSSEKALSIFGWTDRRMDEQDGEALIGRSAIYSEKNINNFRMDGWTDGRKDGRTDICTDR